MNKNSSFNSIKDLIDDYAQGKMIIMLDDENRENEGDLMIAAEKITPESINFMAQYGRGLICLTLTKIRCEKLHLPLMVKHQNKEGQHTNFTLSIDAAKNISTGISAKDRATTIKYAVASNANPSDIVQPGHIFPLQANEHGVLQRAGHTEAGCDLAKLAGFEPASVIVEILNPDGSMARKNDLIEFAKQNQLKIGTIADLIEYRMANETTIESVQNRFLKTTFGNFMLTSFLDKINNRIHLALANGTIEKETPTLVRVHVQETLSDLFDAKGIKRNITLKEALKTLGKQPPSILIILDQGQNLVKTIEQLPKQKNSPHAPICFFADDERSYGIGAQILTQLGAKKICILGAKKSFGALSGFHLEIVGYKS